MPKSPVVPPVTAEEPTRPKDKSFIISMPAPERTEQIAIEPDAEPSPQFSKAPEPDEQPHPNKTRLTTLFSRRKAAAQSSYPTAPPKFTMLKHLSSHSSALHVNSQEKKEKKKKNKSNDRIWFTSAECPVVLDISRERRMQRPATSLGIRLDSTTLGKLDEVEPTHPFDPPAPLKRQASASTAASLSGIARSNSNGSSTPMTSPALSETSSASWNFPPKSAESSVEDYSSDEAPAIPMKSPLRSLSSHKRNLTSSTIDSFSISRPSSAAPTSAPSVKSAPSVTMVASGTSAPSITSAPSVRSALTPQPSLQGRPTKKNDYWGFCKGAWAIREAPASGLKLQTHPTGCT